MLFIILALLITVVVVFKTVKVKPHITKPTVLPELSTTIEEQPTWDFSPKPIPESTYTHPPVAETLTPKKEVAVEPTAKTLKAKSTPKKKTTSKNTAKVKPLAKMDATKTKK